MHPKGREGAAACPGPLKMHRVPQKAVLRTEYLLRTREGGFRYRISLPYQRSLFFTPGAPENAPRTTGACFLHRAHIPYHRRPSPVPNEPNATNGWGKKPLPQTEPSANSSQMPGKRPLPQTALPEIQQTPKEASSLDSTIGKFPTTAIPWQQGIVYSGSGAPTHGFNYFLTLFL